MRQRRKNLAFYAEALLLTLFLLLAAAVLVQMFGTAGRLGRTAADENAAALIAQNMTAEFAAAAPPFDAAGETTRRYAADGTESPDGRYRATALVESAATDAPGSLWQLTLTVTARDETAPFYTVTSERYTPAAATPTK